VDARGVIHAVFHNWKAGAHAASADRGQSRDSISFPLAVLLLLAWLAACCDASQRRGCNDLSVTGRTWRWFGGNCSSARGASSLDWSRSVWPSSFTFANGTSVTPHRRERPHVVLGPGGVVTALTTAVQLGEADATWTLVQPTLSEG